MAASLKRKLQIKPGNQLVVLNATPALSRQLARRLHGVEVSESARGTTNAIIAFVKSLAQARKLAPRAIRRVELDGLVWIAYPKGSSEFTTDVNRDLLCDALKPTGWRPVRIVSLDDTWSALRFRPKSLVRSS